MMIGRWDGLGLGIAFTVALAVGAPAAPALAQQPATSRPGAETALPTVSPADYGRFERLGAFELDPNGRWLVASITRVDGDGSLRLHSADGSGEPIVLEYGSGAEFSRDGRWLAYRKGVPAEQREDAEEPIHDRLGLVDLTTLEDTVLFDISSFAFRDDGALLAALGVAPSDSVGADLLVFDPGGGTRTVVGNVDDYAWQDEGSLLAATLKTAWGTTNGVVLFDPEASTLRTLDSGDADYVELTWREASNQLAVMRSVESDEREEASHDVLVWTDVRTSGPTTLTAVGGPVPADLRVTPFRGITFISGGRTLALGVRPWEPVASADEDESHDEDANADGDTDEDAAADVEPADVQVWHWDDDQIIRAQEYAASRIARQSHVALWGIDGGGFHVLGDDLEEGAIVVADGRWALVPDYGPYLFERRFGAGTADWYRVDPGSGERALLAEGLDFGPVSKTDSDRVLIYADDAWHSVNVGTLTRTTLAGGRSFTRSLADYDYPGPRPHWGVGALTEDGSTAYLYDAHDVHRVDLTTGEAERVTDGAERGLRYRIVDPEAEGFFFGSVELESDDDLWFSVFDLRTKASGYARAPQGGRPETLTFEDARVGGLTAAADSDRLALRMERWDDSPDVFVGDHDLEGLTQVTRTNPFQSEFAWGRAELLDYTTDAGHDLQAILVYPANFSAGQRYPLILYQYEQLSDGLHAYAVPNERDYYDFQAWSQEGYFLLMPDIVYEPGRPGPSALDAVEHALDAAVGTGHVDPERMGLIGHSWGGYQAAYLPTRTDRFAASVAGAAITNFLSFMGAVHWNGGLPETGHWETGQARMAAPYWEDLEGHLESSPAHFIADLETPMLLMHGDEDGVVDFYQGLEFYNYARRAGKEVVLLVYPGADHGLSDESQQVDYHRRIIEWFGHYLKGEPAPKWITDGETWVEREKRMNGKR